MHAIGYVGSTSAQARSEFFPAYRAVFGPIGQKAGWPPISHATFDAMTATGQALIVGDEDEVALRLVEVDAALGGVSRICLQMSVGPLRREFRRGAIARLAVSPQRYAGAA